MGKQGRLPQRPITANDHEIRITRAILGKTDPGHSQVLTHVAAEGLLLSKLNLPSSRSTPEATFNAAWDFIVQLRVQKCLRSRTTFLIGPQIEPDIEALHASFKYDRVEQLVRLLGYAQTGEMHARTDPDRLRKLLWKPGPECRIYGWTFLPHDEIFEEASENEYELMFAILMQAGQYRDRNAWLDKIPAQEILRRSGLEKETLEIIWNLVTSRKPRAGPYGKGEHERLTKNDVVAMLRLVSYALQQPFQLHARLYETRQPIPSVLVELLLSSEQRPQIPSSSTSPASASVAQHLPLPLPSASASPPPPPPKPVKNCLSTPPAKEPGPTPATPAPAESPLPAVAVIVVASNPVTVQEVEDPSATRIPSVPHEVIVAATDGIQPPINEETSGPTNTTGATTPQIISTSQPPQSSPATQLRPATPVLTSGTSNLGQSSSSTNEVIPLPAQALAEETRQDSLSTGNSRQSSGGAAQLDGSHGVNPTSTDAEASPAGRDESPVPNSSSPHKRRSLPKVPSRSTPNDNQYEAPIPPGPVQSSTAGVQPVADVRIALHQAVSLYLQEGLPDSEPLSGPAAHPEGPPPPYTPNTPVDCEDGQTSGTFTSASPLCGGVSTIPPQLPQPQESVWTRGPRLSPADKKRMADPKSSPQGEKAPLSGNGQNQVEKGSKQREEESAPPYESEPAQPLDIGEKQTAASPQQD